MHLILFLVLLDISSDCLLISPTIALKPHFLLNLERFSEYEILCIPVKVKLCESPDRTKGLLMRISE